MALLSNALREIEDLPDPGFTLPDGCRFSARVWRPVEAVGALLSPRPDDLPRDPRRARARRNGYALEEQEKALEPIDWLERPPWYGPPVVATGPRQQAIHKDHFAAGLTACGITFRGGSPKHETPGWGTTIRSRTSRATDPAQAGKARRGIGTGRPMTAPALPSDALPPSRRASQWPSVPAFTGNGRGALSAAAAKPGPIASAADHRIPHHQEVADSRPREGL